MADRVILSGMRFYGFHGVSSEEKRLGQNFLVDVELHMDLQRAGANDDLKSTADYSLVYMVIKEIMEGPSFKLIEAVAERIAERILSKFAVKEVVVRVHKPRAPIPGPFDCVTVEVCRVKRS